MEAMPALMIVLVLVAAILVNFICLIYVSVMVHGDDGVLPVIIGVFRHRYTFIRGWQAANDLGIKPVMIAWTITIVTAFLIVSSLLIIYVVNGSLWGAQ